MQVVLVSRNPTLAIKDDIVSMQLKLNIITLVGARAGLGALGSGM